MVKRKGNKRFKKVERKGRMVYVLKKNARKITKRDRAIDRRNLRRRKR